MTNQAIDILLRGGTVITATQRLARHLRETHDRRQAQTGHVWPTARAFSLDAWLAALWEEALVQGLVPPLAVLTAHQERALWEQVIETHPAPEAAALLRPDGSARAASRSYRLALRWGLDPALHRDDPSPDARAFAAWAERFQRQCADREWLSAAALAHRLADLGDALGALVPKRIHLLGFDRHDPASLALFRVLAGGATIEDLDAAHRVALGEVRRTPCNGPREECEAAAAWAWRLLKAGDTGPFGVVIHDLAARRTEVETVFARALHPAGLPEDATQRLFNISQGTPLDREGVVHAALAWLRLATVGLDLDAFGTLARSPYIGVDPEPEGRARFDLQLRREGRTWIRLPERRDERLGWPGLFHAPAFWNALRSLRRKREETTVRLDTARWAERFGQWLRAAHWPGEQKHHQLKSREFQAVHRFRQLLDEFAALSAQAPAMSAGEAVERLVRLAAETPFQAQSGDAPVQILGLLEAGGLRFEHLWVTGMAEDVWPAAPRPDPFLPLHKQREQGMPHADAATELAFARQVTRRLAGAAPSVTFSYPLRREEQELAPSPLIAGYAEAVLESDAVATWRARIAAAGADETIEDVQGAPTAADAEIRGGTAVLRDQSCCPFRAYARHRLDAREPEQPADGPDARARGSLLHDCLQSVWEDLKDAEGLAAMDDDRLRSWVAAIVRAQVAVYAEEWEAAYAGGMAALEADRVTDLILEWLYVERRRPPFRVLETEQERTLRFGPLYLRGKIDRVDVLENGLRVVMDYKTGRVSPSAWAGERPDEPQLPAYALADEADGLCFAQIRTGEMKLMGLAREDEPTMGLKTGLRGESESWDWPERMGRWQGVLDGLADGFAQGRAAVDPNSGRACDYCELGGFCRIRA